MQTAGMIRVQMSQDDGGYVVGADAKFQQLRSDLLFGSDVESNRQSEVRMPARKVTRVARPGGLTRIHEDDAFGRLDRPGVDGERFGPGTVAQNIDLPQNASASPNPLAGLYPDRSRLDGVDF